MWHPLLGVFTPPSEIISGFTWERKLISNIARSYVPIRRVS
jgi:hypothetical protein